MLVRRFSLVMLLMLAFPLAMNAQEEPDFETVVDGLTNPRNFSFDAEGNLYIAEAGNGGPQLTSGDDPYGADSVISMVTPDGEREVVVSGLISYRQGNSLGAHAVNVVGDGLWVLLGETADFTIPFTHALVELDMENGRVQTFVDLLTTELVDDPDGNPNQQSNPTDFEVLPDGTVLIANAGCNCLMSWDGESVGVPVVWSFEDDNPVPTALEVGPDGSVYVGFLTGFPFPEGGSRVERWVDGELVETFEGLTAVTGLEVTDEGEVYAVEIGISNQNGRVMRVSSEGNEVVAEGLNTPYAIQQGPDGRLYVSVGAIGGQNGAIIALPE